MTFGLDHSTRDSLMRTLLATLVAWVGGAIGLAMGNGARRRLNSLVYAAMGVLLAITLCDILPEARGLLTLPGLIIGVASGYALFHLIGRYVSHICPSCAISSFDEAAAEKLGQSVVLLMIALAVHSTMDGLAVVVSDRLSAVSTPGILFAVSFHKLPEGIALVLLLLGAGYSRRNALLWTLAIESTTELGGLAGVLAFHQASPAVLGLLFAHVGGGFLYLAGTTMSGFFGTANRPRPRDIRSLMVSGGSGFLFTSGLIYLINLFHPPLAN